jgi:hypothetical protein
MTVFRGKKLKETLTTWPRNALFTTDDLKARGVSPSLLQEWRKSGWIVSLGRGVMYRQGDTPTWVNALELLNRLSPTVHIGGRTSFELAKVSQYVRGPRGQKFLYVQDHQRLPPWFLSFVEKENLNIQTRGLFTTNLSGISLTEYLADGVAVVGSTLERASIELSAGVDDELSYNEAKELVQALVSPRLNLLAQLLQNCESVRAKRVFLHLAEACNHKWYADLDLTCVDLGRGPREVVKKGRFDARFQITVPDSNDKGEVF